jgi:nicotinamidase-related amidase
MPGRVLWDVDSQVDFMLPQGKLYVPPAILGFLRRGRRVRFVEDAARGLVAARVAKATAVWRENGVEFSTADEVVTDLSG